MSYVAFQVSSESVQDSENGQSLISFTFPLFVIDFVKTILISSQRHAILNSDLHGTKIARLFVMMPGFNTGHLKVMRLMALTKERIPFPLSAGTPGHLKRHHSFTPLSDAC